jgi:hypothetical protein
MGARHQDRMADWASVVNITLTLTLTLTYDGVQRRQLEEKAVGVIPEADERQLLEAVTKQRSEDRDWEHYSVRDSDLWSVVKSCVLKCPINPITNPDPLYNHVITRQYRSEFY